MPGAPMARPSCSSVPAGPCDRQQWLARQPDGKETGLSRQRGKIDQLARQCGVDIRPCYRARKGHTHKVTHARRTLQRLLADHGDGHVRLTLRCIVESSPANASQLHDDVIGAVSDVLAHNPDIANMDGLLDAFEAVDLANIRRAQARASERLDATGLQRCWPIAFSVLIVGRRSAEARRLLRSATGKLDFLVVLGWSPHRTLFGRTVLDRCPGLVQQSHAVQSNRHQQQHANDEKYLFHGSISLYQCRLTNITACFYS